jgi:RNA polymerase primary sigma factor
MTMERRNRAGGRGVRASDQAKQHKSHGLLPRQPSQGSGADPLSRYLDELQGCKVLDPSQEIAMAARVEELEIAHFKALLSYPPALDTVIAALEPHLKVPREVLALRKPARGANAGARHERALDAAALRLRELDVARVALADADANVRRAFADKHGSVRYLQRLAKARAAQQAAKNRFMTANLRLVVSLARRYPRNIMPLADLIQEGNLGLMRAVERFDHRRGFRFSTYASWWIRHGFNRALADKARLVRVPVHLQEDAQRAARASAELLAKTGRTPTSAELAHETGLAEEKLAFLEQHPVGYKPTSLDRPLGPDSDTTLIETLAPPEQPEAEATLDEARWPAELDELLGKLTPMEAAILRYRFGLSDGEELTLQEVGDKYNLSRERIRQLQEVALTKLRAELARREEETHSDPQESAA